MNIKKRIALVIFVLGAQIVILAQAKAEDSIKILSEKERAQVRDDILQERFNVLLPKLMDNAELDMWLIISREYNEDPVMKKSSTTTRAPVLPIY